MEQGMKMLASEEIYTVLVLHPMGCRCPGNKHVEVDILLVGRVRCYEDANDRDANAMGLDLAHDIAHPKNTGHWGIPPIMTYSPEHSCQIF